MFGEEVVHPHIGTTAVLDTHSNAPAVRRQPKVGVRTRWRGNRFNLSDPVDQHQMRQGTSHGRDVYEVAGRRHVYWAAPPLAACCTLSTRVTGEPDTASRAGSNRAPVNAEAPLRYTRYPVDR